MNGKLYEHLMYESARFGKRIRMSVWKDKGALTMTVREFEVDPATPEWESFMMFHSFHATVAREVCKRATTKAVREFIDRNFDRARALVDVRVAILEGRDVPTTLNPEVKP